MADDPDRDLIPVREGSNRDCRMKAPITTFPSEGRGPSSFQNSAISKMDRADLEDRLFQLQEENTQLKKMCHQQDDKYKRLAAKLLRLAADRKQKLPSSDRRDVSSEDIINEQAVRIRELEQNYASLQDRVSVLKQQLASHTRVHTAAHCNSRSVSRSPSRQKASNIVSSSDVYQNMPGGESNAVPHDCNAELHTAQEQQKRLVAEVAMLRQQVQSMEQECRLLREQAAQRVAEHVEELVHDEVEEKRQKVAENVEMIRMKRLAQQQAAQIVALQAHNQAMEQELTQLNQNLELVQKENDEFQEQLMEGRKRLSEQQQEVSSLSAYKETVKELREEILDNQREKATLKQHNQQLLALSATALSSEQARERQVLEKAAQLEALLAAERADKNIALRDLEEHKVLVSSLQKQLEEQRKQCMLLEKSLMSEDPPRRRSLNHGEPNRGDTCQEPGKQNQEVCCKIVAQGTSSRSCKQEDNFHNKTSNTINDVSVERSLNKSEKAEDKPPGASGRKGSQWQPVKRVSSSESSTFASDWSKNVRTEDSKEILHSPRLASALDMEHRLGSNIRDPTDWSSESISESSQGKIPKEKKSELRRRSSTGNRSSRSKESRKRSTQVEREVEESSDSSRTNSEVSTASRLIDKAVRQLEVPRRSVSEECSCHVQEPKTLQKLDTSVHDKDKPLESSGVEGNRPNLKTDQTGCDQIPPSERLATLNWEDRPQETFPVQISNKSSIPYNSESAQEQERSGSDNELKKNISAHKSRDSIYKNTSDLIRTITLEEETCYPATATPSGHSSVVLKQELSDLRKTSDEVKALAARLSDEDKTQEALRLETVRELEKCRELLRVQYNLNSLYKKEVESLNRKLGQKEEELAKQLELMKRQLEEHSSTIDELQKRFDMKDNDSSTAKISTEKEGIGRVRSLSLDWREGLFQIHIQNIKLFLEPEQLCGKEFQLRWNFHNHETSYSPCFTDADMDMEHSTLYKVDINPEFLEYIFRGECFIELVTMTETATEVIAKAGFAFSEALTSLSDRRRITILLRSLSNNENTICEVKCWYQMVCSPEPVNSFMLNRCPSVQAVQSAMLLTQPCGRRLSTTPETSGSLESTIHTTSTDHAISGFHQPTVPVVNEEKTCPSAVDTDSPEMCPEPVPGKEGSLDELITPVAGEPPAISDTEDEEQEDTAAANKQLISQQYSPAPASCPDKKNGNSGSGEHYGKSNSVPEEGNDLTFTEPLNSERPSAVETTAVTKKMLQDLTLHEDTSSFKSSSTVQDSLSSDMKACPADSEPSATSDKLDGNKSKFEKRPPEEKSNSILKSGRSRENSFGSPHYASIEYSNPDIPYIPEEALKRKASAHFEEDPTSVFDEKNWRNYSVRSLMSLQHSQKLLNESEKGEDTSVDTAAQLKTLESRTSSSSGSDDEIDISDGSEIPVRFKGEPPSSVWRNSSAQYIAAELQKQDDTLFQEKKIMMDTSEDDDKDVKKAERYSRDPQDNSSLSSKTRGKRIPTPNVYQSVPDCIEIIIHSLTLAHNTAFMKASDVTQLYIEFSFLGYDGEELETMSVPLNNDLHMYYNFRRTFYVDFGMHYKQRTLLSSVLTSEDRKRRTLRFIVVSEPPEEQDRVKDCEEIGYADLDLVHVMTEGRDMVKENVPVKSVDGVERLGFLTVTLTGVKLMQKIAAEAK